MWIPNIHVTAFKPEACDTKGRAFSMEMVTHHVREMNMHEPYPAPAPAPLWKVYIKTKSRKMWCRRTYVLPLRWPCKKYYLNSISDLTEYVLYQCVTYYRSSFVICID
ncbi:hypothetical protein CEXT_152341 [Caerostris extrusa]|uniref:Uncharacterized protein n=1 Tax=Caerostris extrusa TaxID=172846 RepID=A0AAV4TGM6_CAEEX|nr:hypothetical protein CEXT_152341 [Caerostris extrusa]